MGMGKEKGESGQELQRTVTINIVGKPVVRPRTDGRAAETITTEDEGNTTKDLLPISASYPTQSFTSLWNCILRLSSLPIPKQPNTKNQRRHARTCFAFPDVPVAKPTVPAIPEPVDSAESTSIRSRHPGTADSGK
jgi:hypothetical protein